MEDFYGKKFRKNRKKKISKFFPKFPEFFQKFFFAHFPRIFLKKGDRREPKGELITKFVCVGVRPHGYLKNGLT